MRGRTSGAGRLFLRLTLVYGIVVGFCWAEACREQKIANPTQGLPSPRVAILGQDGAQGGFDSRDRDAERAAAFARAWAVVATAAYILGAGVVTGPRAIRLLSGNLLVLLAVLLIIEGGTHVFGLHYPAIARRSSSDRDLWTYDLSKGWFHVPGGTGKVEISGPDSGVVHINSLGLRGKEVSSLKSTDVQRVLVFGDSFVFGVGVDEENLLTSHLERLLDHYLGGKHEVVNVGVSGYSTDQELILLQELGLKLLPDLVVLVVCDNDFAGNTEDFAFHRYYKPYFELDAARRLALRNQPVPILSRVQRVKLFLGQESNLWNFVRSRKSNDGVVMGLLDFFQIEAPRLSTSDPLELTAALVLALAERVDAAGARLLVTNTGHRGERTPLFHALRPRLSAAGIHHVGLEDMLGRARREAPDKYWDFPGDTHWNRDSHRLAAEVLCSDIMKWGLLSSDRRTRGSKPTESTPLTRSAARAAH